MNVALATASGEMLWGWHHDGPNVALTGFERAMPCMSLLMTRRQAQSMYEALGQALHDAGVTSGAADDSPLDISDEPCPPGVDPLDLTPLAGDPSSR